MLDSAERALRIKDLSVAQFARFSELLDGLLELADTPRAQRLAELLKTDPDYALLLQRLLRHGGTNSSRVLLETRELLHGMSHAVTQDEPPLVGRHVGPYLVLSPLGRGGMGSVWLAQRDDGLFTRQVALKLVNRSLADRSAFERFAREREILAGLTHPNIARLYDAGVGEDGQPFLALQYVAGVPITVYCDQHRSDIQVRLKLFLQVLSAVQYAHANLVIHRDLKPSNILVTADGEVQLLDFGIAKLLSTGEARETELTRLSGRALTPEFAAPEQIMGGPVTTSTDVYSLGVILYELLTGGRPYRLKRDSPAALEEAVLAADPVRPSQGALAAPAAAARGTTVRRLSHALRGDLDTIVLKALRKSPAERYATVEALTRDIENHIRGLPVLARPDSAWYRARKFVARHKIGVAATAGIVIALAATLGVAAWQAKVARQSAASAQREAQRARSVQAFLTDLFSVNTDAQPDPVRARQMTARELLDRGARRIGEALRDSPEAEDETLGTLAEMYRAVGSDEDEAEMQRRRVELRRRIYGERDWRVAEALLDYASTVSTTDARSQMPALVQQARQIVSTAKNVPVRLRIISLEESARANMYVAYTRMRDDARAARELAERTGTRGEDLATVLGLEGYADYSLGDWQSARVLHERALDELRPVAPGGIGSMITSLLELAFVHQNMAHVETAERLYREALRLSRERNGDSHIDTLHAEINLAQFLHETSRTAESRRLQAHALERVGQERGTDTPSVVGSLRRRLAEALLEEGDLEKAAPLIASTLELRRRLYPNSTLLAKALYAQSSLDVARGRLVEADSSLDEAWRISRNALGPARQALTDNPFRLLRAQLRIAAGKAADTVDDLQAVVAAPLPPGVSLATDRVAAYAWLAAGELQLGHLETALSDARAAMSELEGSPVREYYQTLEAQVALRLGQAELRQGDARGARDLLERALALRKANHYANSPWIAESALALAECLDALADPGRARALRRDARRILALHTELGRQFSAR